MLKNIIDKLEDVKEEFRSLYKEGADGKFYLQVDGDDREALIKAKDNEKKLAAQLRDELNKTKKDLKDLADKKTLDDDDRLKKDGDIVALEASWKVKLDEAVAAKQTEVDTLNASLKKNTVDAVALKMAVELSKSPELLVPFIEKRLAMEMSEGKAITRVLDAEGKPSALSLEDLKKEISTDERFAAIVTGTQASGSGAKDADKGGSQTHKKLVWADYTSSELVTLRREDQAKYDLLKKTQGEPKTKASV